MIQLFIGLFTLESFTYRIALLHFISYSFIPLHLPLLKLGITHRLRLLLDRQRERLPGLHPTAPFPPDILAAGLSGPVLGQLLVSVVLSDHVLLDLAGRIALDAHAEPKIVPVLAARADAAVAVQRGELAAEGLAVVGQVEGLFAVHLRRKEGLGEGGQALL